MEQKAPSEEIDISLEDLKEDRKSTNADQIKVSNGNELLILDADDKNMAGDKDMDKLEPETDLQQNKVSKNIGIEVGDILEENPDSNGKSKAMELDNPANSKVDDETFTFFS